MTFHIAKPIEVHSMAIPLPFDGIRVIDTSQVLAAPYASYQLALLGADVIKVENPSSPDFVRQVGTDPALNDRSMGTQFLTQNAGKRFLTLDLKDERGRTALKDLVRGSDVFVTNARPGAFERLGLGYRDLAAINPRLVHCAVSAFGARGPKREHTGYENVVQATSGYMSANGDRQLYPLRQGSPAIDYATGLTAAFAVAGGLVHLLRTGEGMSIDVGMIDVAAALMACHVTSHLRDGFEPVPTGNTMALATTSMYATKEGSIMLGTCNTAQMERLWTLLERPDLIKPDPFDSPVADFEQEHAVLSAIMLTRTAQEWEDHLQDHHIPAARVRETLADALYDTQYAGRGAFAPTRIPGIDGPLGLPLLGFMLGADPLLPSRPPMPAGAHSREILTELGYSEQAILDLLADGVTSAPDGS
ncbi:CoA transferase [Acrocarpospora pleiomorpha]|uniref:CoA transferase n=1 Tax=Acrocarpospora pleiomorpha TaxID=90975 RepID=A0A5M3X7W7_9ACTN|nr:CoA transferase [Acrocarpospora pleiomorpha]GES17204.1 CoA transferase [Acrocarpospora pleiomorpha]